MPPNGCRACCDLSESRQEARANEGCDEVLCGILSDVVLQCLPSDAPLACRADEHWASADRVYHKRWVLNVEWQRPLQGAD